MNNQIVLPCWVSDNEGVAFELLPDGTMEVSVSENGMEATVLLSSLSQDKLYKWLGMNCWKK